MQRLLFCLITTLFVTPSALAGDWYFGGKMGSNLVDLKENLIDTQDDSKDPKNAGIFIGWEQSVVLGDLGLEFDLTKTTSEGKSRYGEDLSIDTVGLYGVYRTPGFIYFKAKAGVIKADQTYSNLVPGSDSLADDDSSSSLGLGIGFSVKLIQVEIEFTRVNDRTDMLSVGVKF